MRNGQDVRDLLKVREVDYGNSWILTGRIMSLLIAYAPMKPEMFGKFWHPIFMIVVKLCRALVTPAKRDHWRDIQGYAQLVLDDLGDEDDLPSE